MLAWTGGKRKVLRKAMIDKKKAGIHKPRSRSTVVGDQPTQHDSAGNGTFDRLLGIEQQQQQEMSCDVLPANVRLEDSAQAQKGSSASAAIDVWTLLSDTADKNNQRATAKQDNTPVHNTEICMNHAAEGDLMLPMAAAKAQKEGSLAIPAKLKPRSANVLTRLLSKPCERAAMSLDFAMLLGSSS